MNKTAEQLPVKTQPGDPVRITTPEPWTWEVLAKAFLPDPTLNFWLGKKTNEKVLRDFFEEVVKDTLSSGGEVFGSPDHKAVLVWTRLGYTLEPPTEWKQRWYDVLDPEGVKRYYWLYEAGELGLDEDQLKRSMLPDYGAVLPESQGRGYMSHLLKWTVNYYEEQGYDVPFILASTRRSAKLYCPLVGFHLHKEVFVPEFGEIPVGVFLKRNKK
ncbi:MAG TPA: GNAT family N-acetyltransferase [Chitinophaga sp.]|uniref:GNAT family N-acetyltransferase n=1 Tax=Chitinophaga sp. TaxID=1869181 RepID=UPI002F927EB1